MSTLMRARAEVRGVVQGVGFRYFVLGEARQRGLTGFTRNRPDGTVDVLVEGESGLVEEFLSCLRIGPPASRVSALQVERQPHTGEFATFEVRH